MKRILVAGGAGFIGTNLCIRLLQLGFEVICIDNLFSGNISNIEMLQKFQHFSFVYHDICEPYECENINTVINLACPASPVFYQKDPIYTTKTCVYGTINMLELAKNNNCVFLQASTSEVYGDANITPQPEVYWGNVNPNGIRACYDEGKRCAESLCLDFYRQYHVPTKIIRIFNTYGPYMRTDDGRVISNLICQSLKNETMTIYGNGDQTRSFMYIDDLINGILSVLKTQSSFVGPINLGNPQEIKIKDLAEKIKSLTNSNSDICYYSLPQDDPRRRCPNILLAQKELEKWTPKIDLLDGLKKTIEYFKSIELQKCTCPC